MSKATLHLGSGGILAVGLVLAGWFSAAAAPTKEPRPATGYAQDFVFLGEARPVLIRLQVSVDGTSVLARGTSSSGRCSATWTSTATAC